MPRGGILTLIYGDVKAEVEECCDMLYKGWNFIFLSMGRMANTQAYCQYSLPEPFRELRPSLTFSNVLRYVLCYALTLALHLSVCLTSNLSNQFIKFKDTNGDRYRELRMNMGRWGRGTSLFHLQREKSYCIAYMKNGSEREHGWEFMGLS